MPEADERLPVEQALRQTAARLEAKVAERTTELAARATQLRALALKLAHAEETERARIAHVLHGDVQQLLAAAQMKLARAAQDAAAPPEVAQAKDLITQTIAVARSLVGDLVPPSPQHGDFADAIQWLIERERERYGLEVTLDAVSEVDLEANVRSLVFRALQELLFNVVKHAGVKQAAVKLESADGVLRLSVEDRGVGIAPHGGNSASPAHEPEPTGLGLFGIRERIEAIGGSMDIQSVEGGGTRVVLTIPASARR